MKPFRKNVAIAIDGGGIRGIIVARALARLEEHLEKPIRDIFRLTAGTSTGAVIAAGIALGLPAEKLHSLYLELGSTIFRKSLRSTLWPLYRYRYPNGPLEEALKKHLGTGVMGDFWTGSPRTDVVITVFDLVENRTRFVKPWKPTYADWPVVKAVLASSTIPTYFPVVDGRYVDGGVGSYSNPCYLAAYELTNCLNWDPAETTLISLGTGRNPKTLKEYDANRLWVWQWLGPIVGAFLQSADDQQVRVVSQFFNELDFRRFQVDLRSTIEPDDPSRPDELTSYGDELWEKILSDETDKVTDITAGQALP
jgi:hypothetical protein